MSKFFFNTVATSVLALGLCVNLNALVVSNTVKDSDNLLVKTSVAKRNVNLASLYATQTVVSNAVTGKSENVLFGFLAGWFALPFLIGEVGVYTLAMFILAKNSK